jgi:aryl-alcohol dehydrogenase-like predicted oxidoreductase
MEMRSFHNDALISVLGIGCGRVASISNPVPMREIEATLEAAVEAGVTLFDTADIYGQGDSERTLSRLLRRHRDQMFVVTKVGGRHSRYAGVIRIAKPLIRMIVRSKPHARSLVVKARTAMVRNNFNPADLRRAVEASRRRLGLDQLDGLLLHSPSLETLRNPEIHDFLIELLHLGRAAHVGASVESVPEVEAAMCMPAVTILQLPVGVADALSGTTLLERIRQRKIGILVRGVLAGLIPGSYALRQAVSIALSRDYITSAIVGVSTRHHLDQLLSVVS